VAASNYAPTQTPGELAAGVSPVNTTYPVGYVDRYVNNTTPGTGSNDMALAFNKAFLVSQQVGCGIRFGATKPYLFLSPVNYTTAGQPNLNGVLTIYDGAPSTAQQNMPIIANHTGHVFDCSGTPGCIFFNVGIASGFNSLVSGGNLPNNTGLSPKTGFFFARNNANTSGHQGPTAGILALYNCNVVGSFSVSNFYNYAAEQDLIIGGYWSNTFSTGPTATMLWTSSNIKSQTSTYQTLAQGVAQSCTDHKVFGGEFLNYGGQSTGSDVFYIEGVASHRTYAPYVYCNGGRSLLYCDMSANAPSFYVTMDGWDGETSVPQYGILFSGTSGNTPGNWKIDNCRLPNSTLAITVQGSVSGVTLDNFRIRALIDPANNGISIPGTIQNSVFDTGGLNLNIGSSHNNSLTGDSSKWTIGARSGDTWNDTTSQNRNWVPTFTSGFTFGSGGTTTAVGKFNFIGGSAKINLLLSNSSSIAWTTGAVMNGNLGTTAIGTPSIPTCTSTEPLAVYNYTTGAFVGMAYMSGNTIVFAFTQGASSNTFLLAGTYDCS
jgi:hypothetical protein